MEFHQATSIVTKKRDGHFSRPWEHLDVVQRGECIAIYDDGSSVFSPIDGAILLPHEKGKIGEEWFYLGKKMSKPTLRLG